MNEYNLGLSVFGLLLMAFCAIWFMFDYWMQEHKVAERKREKEA